MNMEGWWNDTDREESTGKETCHSATLYTTNPTRTDLVLNPCLRGERQTIKYCDQYELHIQIQSVPLSKHSPSWL